MVCTFVISPTVTRDESKTKQSETRQNKTKAKTVPSSVRSILYYTISHEWMHLGKYSVLIASLDNRCGIILFTYP
jgi:uncharacterized damage-inducible protein DinB